MKVKSGLFRRLLTVAARWECTTGYIHNDSVFVTKESQWYRIMLPATLKDIDATFAIDDLKTAISPTRGYVNVMLTPVSLAIETRTVMLEQKHFQLPPRMQMTSQPGTDITTEIEGLTWTTFAARTAPIFNAFSKIKDEYDGILFDGTGKTLKLVATNGVALLQYDTGITSTKIRVTVPRETCALWQPTEKFLVTFCREYVIFQTEEEEMTSKIAMTIFPSYWDLLVPGENTITFNSDDILFTKKIRTPYVNLNVREKYIVFEWYDFNHGETPSDKYNGEVKINAKCTQLGRVSVPSESFKMLTDYGPLVTVYYTRLGLPMVASLGGYTYVFRGNGNYARND